MAPVTLNFTIPLFTLVPPTAPLARHSGHRHLCQHFAAKYLFLSYVFPLSGTYSEAFFHFRCSFPANTHTSGDPLSSNQPSPACPLRRLLVGVFLFPPSPPHSHRTRGCCLSIYARVKSSCADGRSGDPGFIPPSPPPPSAAASVAARARGARGAPPVVRHPRRLPRRLGRPAPRAVGRSLWNGQDLSIAVFFLTQEFLARVKYGFVFIFECSHSSLAGRHAR